MKYLIATCSQILTLLAVGFEYSLIAERTGVPTDTYGVYRPD
jgi:hypothetical protein